MAPHTFTVVSFYTRGYKDEAKRLTVSCDEFKIRHDIRELDSKGSWQANTQYKAQFMRDMRRDLDGPIVWLDADAEVKKYPTAFDVLEGEADVAVHYLKEVELLSGTVWLDDTEVAHELTEKWVYYCKTYTHTWDQQCLDMAIGATHGVRVHRLPPEYTFIFDTMRRFHPDVEPVVEHYQASRRLKHQVAD